MRRACVRVCPRARACVCARTRSRIRYNARMRTGPVIVRERLASYAALIRGWGLRAERAVWPIVD